MPTPITQSSLVQTGYHFPKPQTSFIGLASTIAEIQRQLAQVQILTLTGSGGSGKTRLALRVAEECLADFPDGVYWVDLAALSDPGLLPQVVAATFSLREQPQQSFAELLIEYIRDRALLLVMDNCEHLGAACAELLATLIDAGAGLRVLATSRVPLAVAGEKVWPVPRLAVPSDPATLSLADLKAYEAVRLFDERAQRAFPGFALNEQNIQAVAQLCRQLEGLPLAIELAAARANILTPHQILARIDDTMQFLTRGAPDAQPRHQTLRAALDWSFHLLDLDEQTLFVRLSVFADHFNLEAVEGICAGQGLAANTLLDLLANLIDKSLIVAVEAGEEMRYRLLVPVRHYAAERMRATGTEALWRGRHAAWFLELARRAEPELVGFDQACWLERLDRVYGDLRAALSWYAAVSDGIEEGLELCGRLGRFWLARSYLSEGRHWLETMLQKADSSTVSPVYIDALDVLGQIAHYQNNFIAARAAQERGLALALQIEYDQGVENNLVGLGHILWELGEFEEARVQLEKAVHYTRAADHFHTLARSLNALGLVYMHQGDANTARLCLDEGLTLFQRLGNQQGIAIVLWNLAMLANNEGDFTRARFLYQEALHISRTLGNRLTLGDILVNLGMVEAALGNFAAAIAYLEEASQIYEGLGATGDTAYICAELGDIAFHQANTVEAQRHHQEALGLFRQAGNQRLIARSLGRLARIACRNGELTAAAALAAEALQIRRTIGHLAGIIFALDEEYAELAVALGLPTVAARLKGAVESARQKLSRPRPPVEIPHHEAILTHLRGYLVDDALAAAWSEGKAMTLAEAAAYALDTLSPAAVAKPGPEVRIFALGPTRVYRGDHLVTTTEWTYAKARELLLYLLCRPHATREQIGLDFWPDASDEQVRKRFSAALAHARNVLGKGSQWVTLVDGRYSIDPTRLYWFDVDEFEAKLHAAHNLLQNDGPPQQIVSLLDDAIQLYHGDFAEDFQESDWIQSRRISLQRAYLDALLTLGKLYVEGGHHALAIAVYEKALAKDPYLEEAHLALIQAYAQLNRRSQALRQYEALTSALAELNASPSAETEAIVEHLRQG